MNNIFRNIPADIPNEVFEEILANSEIKIERIISKGHVTPENEWYDQEKNEWVILLSGSAELLFEEKEEIKIMKPGDYIFIPAYTRHRVVYTSENEVCVWLAVHF